MKINEFNKLIKEQDSNFIIENYMLNKLNLTDKQLEKVCLKSKHRGGVSFEYKRNKTTKLYK